jgi:hypothetical protein
VPGDDRSQEFLGAAGGLNARDNPPVERRACAAAAADRHYAMQQKASPSTVDDRWVPTRPAAVTLLLLGVIKGVIKGSLPETTEKAPRLPKPALVVRANIDDAGARCGSVQKYFTSASAVRFDFAHGRIRPAPWGGAMNGGGVRFLRDGRSHERPSVAGYRNLLLL